MSRDASGALSSRPIFTRYSGVTDSAIVSPIASWKPSLALSRKSERLLVVGALVEVVPELVMDRREVLGRLLDAHLDAQVVLVVDVPGARVADDVAVRGLTNSERSQKVCGSGAKPSEVKKRSPVLHHLERRRSCAASGSSVESSSRDRRSAARPADRCSPQSCAQMLPSRCAGIGPFAGTTSPYFSRSFSAHVGVQRR